MDRTIAVIDGNSWVHRAYHAVPPVMSLDDGTPTNAVHGFMNMFLSFYGNAQPDAIICAFDAGIPDFRLEAIKQYKAQRKPMDNELRVQFPIIEELLKAMDIPVVKVDGWEGDDVLGTVARICEDCGCKTLLVTGDKDANQLASDKTTIVTSKNEFIGPKEVEEKYGIKVEQFIDYLALMGDSVDNIPGVPGIGPKSAAKLLNDFGTVEGIYENLDKLKGKQKENIENNEEAAYVSRQAATISRDVPIDIDLQGLYFPSFDKDKLTETFVKYKLKSSLNGILKIIGEETIVDDLGSGRSDIHLDKIEICNFEDYLTGKEAIDFAIKSDFLAISIGHKMMPPKQASIFDIETEVENDLLLAVSDGNRTAVIEGDDCVDVLNSKHKLIAENSKELFDTENVFDISLAAYVLNSSKSDYTAMDVYQQICGETLPNIEAEIDKSDNDYVAKKNANIALRLARNAALCAAMYEPIKSLLKKDNAETVFYDIEKPLTPVLAQMEKTGTRIDNKRMKELSESTKITLDELKAEILELATEDFNIDSPKQLAHILFDVLGLPAKKKNKQGYSTNAAVLEELSDLHPLPGKILQYREYAKLRSTYIEALPKLEDSNGLIHTTFHQRKTTTGRLSSSDPNIQNIPTRSSFGNQIRECFIPLSDDDVFLSADYSQIELRLLAHLSEDAGLISAFKSGTDFHSATAASIFGVDEPSRAQRSAAKAVNFGIIYGQQAFGLSQVLKIDISEAKEIIDKYFATYPRVREYLDSIVMEAREKGYAETMFGRRRYIPELSGSKRFQAFGERTAMNHPMQGSAADIIKIAMRKVYDAKLPAKCMMQVHDELDFSCPKGCIDEVRDKVKDIMENVVELQVPLIVDVSYGRNWADAK